MNFSDFDELINKLLNRLLDKLTTKHNEELMDRFLYIATLYSTLDENERSSIAIKLGSGRTFFSQTTTSSTLSAKQSGWINLSMTCNGIYKENSNCLR